jgi:uncharacterized protein (DUF302 family)
MAALSNSGLVRVVSPYTFMETRAKLEELVKSRGLMVFAWIDHSGEASKVGLSMPQTQLLIFGSPKGGTPVMVAAPTVAIDLPLKVLLSCDAEGKVWLSYNAPEYLQKRHDIPEELLKNISGVAGLVQQAVASS